MLILGFRKWFCFSVLFREGEGIGRATTERNLPEKFQFCHCMEIHHLQFIAMMQSTGISSSKEIYRAKMMCISGSVL